VRSGNALGVFEFNVDTAHCSAAAPRGAGETGSLHESPAAAMQAIEAIEAIEGKMARDVRPRVIGKALIAIVTAAGGSRQARGLPAPLRRGY